MVDRCADAREPDGHLCERTGMSPVLHSPTMCGISGVVGAASKDEVIEAQLDPIDQPSKLRRSDRAWTRKMVEPGSFAPRESWTRLRPCDGASSRRRRKRCRLPIRGCTYRYAYGMLLTEMKRYEDAQAQYQAVSDAIADLPDHHPQKVKLHKYFIAYTRPGPSPSRSKHICGSSSATQPSSAATVPATTTPAPQFRAH